MNSQNIPKKTMKSAELMQLNEITAHVIYLKLSKTIKDSGNAKILSDIAADELTHFEYWKGVTKQEVKPASFKVVFFFLVSRLFGLTFGIKLLEKDEEKAQASYDALYEYFPEAKKIHDEEEKHEEELINMVNEERLDYIGSIVLGLNDALVELTGALAGLTFALQNASLIALTGLITGIAASFSMAASEYLSNKSEGETTSKAIKSSVYTGVAYIITVFLLITPYLMQLNVFLSLSMTLLTAVLIIFCFNYYISVAKDYDFQKRFFEMTFISLGVAALSFGIGVLIKLFMPIDI